MIGKISYANNGLLLDESFQFQAQLQPLLQVSHGPPLEMHHMSFVVKFEYPPFDVLSQHIEGVTEGDLQRRGILSEAQLAQPRLQQRTPCLLTLHGQPGPSSWSSFLAQLNQNSSPLARQIVASQYGTP